MIPHQGAAQSDTYLLQQITSATPEQLCVMLLEGAQRFLLQAINAIKARDFGDKSKFVNRVSAIVEELMIQVDTNSENELAVNLSRVYEWWMNQLFEGSRKNQHEKLEMIYTQMGDMKNTWTQLIQKTQSAAPVVSGLSEELMG
jgi:flagellar protein FliS